MVKGLSIRSQLFIATVILFGAVVLWIGLAQHAANDVGLFVCFLLLAIVGSSLKVNLPGVTGTMSVIFLFVLVAVQELSLGQVLLMSCIGAIVQSVWSAKTRPRLIQVAFNAAS